MKNLTTSLVADGAAPMKRILLIAVASLALASPVAAQGNASFSGCGSSYAICAQKAKAFRETFRPGVPAWCAVNPAAGLARDCMKFRRKPLR
jgi:hypothetical protein